MLHSAGPPEDESYRPRRLNPEEPRRLAPDEPRRLAPDEPRRIAPEEESYTESVLVVAEDAPDTTRHAPDTTETQRRKAPAAPLLTVSSAALTSV